MSGAGVSDTARVAALQLRDLCRVVRAAGREIMPWYQHRDLSAAAKADQSPVTQADLAGHRALVKGLAALLPGVPIVSEEGAEGVPEMQALVDRASLYWLIDPLDGTRDFLRGSGDFTVNAALMQDGQAVVGCVYAPVHGDCLVARQGEGAFAQAEADAGLTPVHGRRADLERFTCLVSRSHQAGEDEVLNSVYPHAVCEAVGSSLKYLRIAAGQADLALRMTPTSLWDTAASQCILEAAGGALLDFSGAPVSYRTGSLINPPFVAVGERTFPWQEVLSKVREAYRKRLPRP